jgi:hypothetical protein
MTVRTIIPLPEMHITSLLSSTIISELINERPLQLTKDLSFYTYDLCSSDLPVNPVGITIRGVLSTCLFMGITNI